MSELYTLHVGDALTVLRTMPDASVDCIVTSPPYWGLRDYGTPPVIFGGDPECAHDWTEHVQPAANGLVNNTMQGETMSGTSATRKPKKSSNCHKCGAWRGQLGLEPTIGQFIAHLTEIFEECRRVLRPTGNMWVNMGDAFATGAGGAKRAGGGSQGKNFKGPDCQPNRLKSATGLAAKNLIGQPWRLAFALQDAGWILRRDIIWHKPSCMPESAKDRCTTAHEYIFHFVKQRHYYYDWAAISEPTTGGAHDRGKGVNPKSVPVTGWDKSTGDGRHGSVHKVTVPGNYKGSVPGRNGGPGQDRRGKGDRGPKRDVADERTRATASVRMGREPGWRSRQNESFSAAVTKLVDRRNARSVWTISTKPYKAAHFATFPPEIPRRCILASCPPGGVVLDIFAGSGTTIAEAVELGCFGIAIELSQDYAPLIEFRVAAAIKRRFEKHPSLFQEDAS